MTDDAKAAPRVEVLTGAWSDLQPHAERAAIFIIQGDLDLTEVAEKVMNDDVQAVGPWIESGAIGRPTPAQTDAWDKTPARFFRFVIVQPYVLIQEMGH